MKVLIVLSAIIIGALSILYNSQATATIKHFFQQHPQQDSMPAATTAARNMSKSIPKIIPRPSSERGHANHGWLNTYHTFSFASYYDPRHQSFGSLRVLNEDRVAANSGFPTHPHRDFEIFSYILNGELTHRDSMLKKGQEGKQGDDFYRMKRGDVQFTTGGTGIAHSEFNESNDEVHFLQIWALPWSKGLKPRYHTLTFSEEKKRQAFLPILSPLAARRGASAAEEDEAKPALPDTIPIHADFVMAAGILAPGSTYKWTVGAADKSEDVVQSKQARNVYVHLPMLKGGHAKIRIGVEGAEAQVLAEGDGAYVKGVDAGSALTVESVGDADAEVIVLDSD